MNPAARSLAETTQKAIAVLSKELGIVEAVRFLTQFSYRLWRLHEGA
jgi:hypothetical protein